MSLLLYIVRHAPVIKQDGIVYGRDAEIDTASSLFNAAAQALPKKPKIWISSQFERAIQTMRVLKEIMENKDDVHILSGYNEQNFGELVGKTKASIHANPTYTGYLQDRINIAPPYGESVVGMVERVRHNLNDLASQMKYDGEAVIVAHGGIVRAATQLTTGQPFLLQQKVPYLSVHRFELSGPL